MPSRSTPKPKHAETEEGVRMPSRSTSLIAQVDPHALLPLLAARDGVEPPSVPVTTRTARSALPGVIGRAPGFAQQFADAVRVRLRATVLAGRRPTRGDDRGDVPGWVLVTLMTAGLVLTLWAAAGPRLEGVFNDAIDRVVSGP
jgi:hypothetical protein